MIVQLNAVYLWIYRAEIPFLEQYKVEKDVPWPWKVEGKYEEWKALVIKSFIQCMFNNTVINVGMLLLYCQVFYGW
jgi:hypothetical protein